jgi:hypothetical protein
VIGDASAMGKAEVAYLEIASWNIVMHMKTIKQRRVLLKLSRCRKFELNELKRQPGKSKRKSKSTEASDSSADGDVSKVRPAESRGRKRKASTLDDAQPANSLLLHRE